MFCHPSSPRNHLKYGSWGVKENFQDVNNPKYLALQNCVFIDNSLSSSEINKDENTIIVFPNPTNEFVTVNDNHTNKSFEYKILDLTGTMLNIGNARFNEQINIENLTSGNYLIQIEIENGKKFTKKLIKK